MSDPPGVLDSSTVGVRGSGIDFESLLGAFVADFARRWLSEPAVEELSRLVADLEACSGVLSLALVADVVLPAVLGLASTVGVGGVTNVEGVSDPLGGVEGGSVETGCNRKGSLGVDLTGSGSVSAASPGGVGSGGISSSVRDPLREPLAPFLRNLPSPPPLPVDLTESVSPDPFGSVDLRGTKASFSFPTGEGLRSRDSGDASVVACLGARLPLEDCNGWAGSACGLGASRDSALMSGEDRVR